MKKIIALVILMFALLSMAGVAVAADSLLPAENFGAGKRVGFSDVSGGAPFGRRLQESIIGTGRKYGFDVIFADAQSNASKQLADIEDFIVQNVDYIVIHPVDSEAVGGALLQAKAAGIPVFLVAVARLAWAVRTMCAISARMVYGKAWQRRRQLPINSTETPKLLN